MELAGHKCVGFCEFDKFAVASYTSMHLITDEQRAYLATLPLNKRQKEILKEEYRNGEWFADDIRGVDGRDVPHADCWCFGAPCQDFSVAGLRKGLDGDRSSLVKEIFRLLREVGDENRPEWLIYENVKGMLSSNGGWDYLAILLEMDELGYDLQWQNLNSKDFIVPQNRERIYTVGHIRDGRAAKVFPIEGTDGENLAEISLIGTRKGYHRNLQTFSGDGITEALSTCEGGGREHHTIVPICGIDKNVGGGYTDIANTITSREDRGVSTQKQDRSAVVLPIIYDDYNSRFRDDNLSCSLTSKCGSGGERSGMKVCVPVLTPDRVNKKQHGGRFKGNGEESFTLTSEDRHGVMISVDGFNTEDDGTCRTIKAQQSRNTGANFIRKDSLGATAVEVQIREATKQGYAVARGGETPSTSRQREVKQDADESG